jgi:hypothetical protein
MSDHEFQPQTLGSAFCGECGQRFEAPEHNYPESPLRGYPYSSESIASDLLENMERDVAEERQFRQEEFGDDWPL